ncbi:MAG TPA: hypothetical protein VGB85_30880, partial [Nannocystis sp.]
ELHRLTPRVRAAAGVLMTRRFVKADELSVDIKASDGRRLVKIRALASGDNQIAGWLASFIDPGQPEMSGVFPVAREPSGIYPAMPVMPVMPVAREPSGMLPAASMMSMSSPTMTSMTAAPSMTSMPSMTAAPREPSGVYPAPLAHESGVMPMASAVHSMPGMSQSLASAEASGVRPVSRHSSGALSMARSGPLRAAREANEERDAAASEAALAVNVAMLTDPEMPLPSFPEPPATPREAPPASAPQLDAAAGVDPLDRLTRLAGLETVDPRDANEPAAPVALAGSDALGVPPGPDAPIASATDPRVASVAAPPSSQPLAPPVVWSSNAAPPAVALAGLASASTSSETPSTPPELPPRAPPATAPTFAPPALPRPPVIARPPASEPTASATPEPPRDPDETR